MAHPRKTSPSIGLSVAHPRKSSPGTPENSIFRPFWACRANFFALTPITGRAGRTFSRTARDDRATLKPPTPLQVTLRAPLKPPTPLQGRNGPKMAFHRSQRRWQFHSAARKCQQRCCRFHSEVRTPQLWPPGTSGWYDDNEDRAERSPPPVVVGPGREQTPEKLHVIRLKEVSTNAENVAIPTRRIQNLKESQGNYVRNS